MPTLVAVLSPGGAPLTLDVAGTPPGEQLTQALATSAEIAVAESGAAAAAAVAADAAASGVLVLDARAWISSTALAALVTHASAGRPFTVLAFDDAGTAGRRVAVFIPRTMVTGPLDPEAALHGVSQANHTVVNGGSLDPDLPVALLDSTRALASYERHVQRSRAAAALDSSVRLRDPDTLYIRGSLSCGTDVVIDANVIIEGRVTLGDRVAIGANCIIRDARIESDTRVQPFTLIEQATIGAGGLIGPYARIRPGTELGDHAQIGNFVEIKNSRIGTRARINHHAFVGDAVLADRVTLGAGTITCNHDGVGTNETVIESDVYVGSGCKLIAPLHIGHHATIAAGSTITENVPPSALTIARARQTTIDHWRGPRRRQK